MAENTSPKTVKVEEEVEGDRILTSDFFFSQIGKAVPILPDGSSFDINSSPGKPLVVSEQFGLVFAAHLSGFCVAKTKDVIVSAKEIKDKGSGASVQESSVLDVPVGRVHILSLSSDSAILAAVVGQDIHCFSVNSLLEKDEKPFSSSSVHSGHVKDLYWIQGIDASFIVLTDDGILHFGAPNKPPKDLMDEVDAVGMCFDGNYVAVARKNALRIYSSEFMEILHILLPPNSWMDEKTANSITKVDSISWVRSDSIVVGCLQLTEDNEENYFVQVIKSKENNIVDGSSMVAAVYFIDLFPGIVDDIVPFGCGPYLFMEYLENCEMAFISNKKNPEEHIMLLAWSQKNNLVSAVDIVEDIWLPRIELQENGDENLILGLCVDKTFVHENVSIKLADGEQRELPPHCLLLCLTLEGKLVVFNVASTAGAGCQSSTEVSSSPNSVAQQIHVVGPSNVGEVPVDETAKKSAINPGSHELSEKKNSFEFDEMPARKDTKISDVKKYSTLTSNSDESWRKESDIEDSMEKGSTNVETCKSGQVGHPLKETLSQFSLNDSHAKNMSSFGGHTAGTELSKNVQYVSAISTVDISSNAGKSSSRVSDTLGSLVGKAPIDSQKTYASGGFTGTPPGILTSKMQPRESTAGAGCQSSTEVSSSPNSGAQQIHAVGPSNVGEVPLDETAKKSAINPGSHELSEKKNSFVFDEMPARKDTKISDVKKYSTLTPKSDESWRKESDIEDSMEKASTNVETCESGQVGHPLKETLSQFSLNDSHAKNMSSFGGHTTGTELSKNVQYVSAISTVDISSNAGKYSSRVSDTFGSLVGKAPIDSQKTFSSGGFTGTPPGILTSKMQPRESAVLPNYIDNNSRYAMKESSIKSFPFGQPNSEHESSKQYSNVQNMANELDKLLEHIEEEGGFIYGCTTAHRSSLETLEASMKSLSERCRGWQSFTEERLGEVRIILDKTVQVLAREKHMEGIVRQTTDEHYLDLWNCQKLNCELGLKRQYLLKRSQDLINQMIELEKHFNSFELNLFGESSVADKSSRALQSRSTSSRHIKSLQAVHSATISQLATAQHLSESLSRQMAVLNVKSPPEKQESLKKKLFESIGITNPVDYLGSGSTGKKVELSAKKSPLVFSSSPMHKESRRNLLCSSSTHDPESARRRRDSLDRSWANFEVPRTTVKRMVVPKESHNVSSSFLSRESKLASLGKLEGTAATYPKILPMQDKNGCQDITMKGNSETVSASMVKSSGAISVVSHAELSPRLPAFGGNKFSAIGEKFTSSSFPLPASLVDPNMKDVGNHSNAKRTGAQIGHIGKSIPTFIEDSKSSRHEPLQEKSNTQKRQPQVLSQTPLTGTFGGRSPLFGSAHDAQSTRPLGFSAISTSSISASIVPARNEQSSVTSIESGSVSIAKTMAKDVGNQAEKRPSPASSVSSNIAETSVLSTPQASQKSEPSSSPSLSPSVGLKFEFPTFSGEVKKQEASTSPLALSTTQPETTSVAQEDEMEEEAPETNQTVQHSLGSSFGGFGIGGPSPIANTISSSRSNPFGGPMTNAPPVSVSLTVPPGDLFRPASLSFQSLQGPQQSQASNAGTTTVGGFASGNSYPSQQPPSGFGQPGQIGSGQQALGSVLGSFGQSRQIGTQIPSGLASGFGGSQSGGGGFGGGFAGVSATSGGFGGFGATASGFAAAPTSAGGFAGAAASGGFGGSASSGSGFGGFSKQGTGGFSGAGSGIGGGARPPSSDLFTQIRR